MTADDDVVYAATLRMTDDLSNLTSVDLPDSISDPSNQLTQSLETISNEPQGNLCSNNIVDILNFEPVAFSLAV